MKSHDAQLLCRVCYTWLASSRAEDHGDVEIEITYIGRSTSSRGLIVPVRNKGVESYDMIHTLNVYFIEREENLSKMKLVENELQN